MKSVIELKVAKELSEEARAHAKARLGFEYNRFNLDQNQRLAMITMGTVGQLIFRKYLTQNKVDFDFQLQAGEFDDFDFVIKNKIVEIKTSGFAKPNDWQSLNGIYNLSQLKAAKKKNYYCSVQLFVNGYDKMTKMFNVNACDTCIIAGWSLIEQIPSFPLVDLPYGKAHLIPLNELRDITDLISL